MRESDYSEFSQVLDSVCGLLSRGGYTPSALNTALWFRSLAAHDLASVRTAFDAHVKDPQRGRFVPTPADILAQIAGLAGDDGRPGPEEAWALALRASDEAATVVWTEEVAQAWGIAKIVHDGGDEVGARMAFKEAYTRLVGEAREARKAPQWSASLGLDKAQQGEAIKRAEAAGLLPPPAPAPALPAPRRERNAAGKSVADILEEMKAKARARLEMASAAKEASRSIGKFKPIDPETLPPAMRGAA